MQRLVIHHRPPVISRRKLPLLVVVDSFPSFDSVSRLPISPSCKFFSLSSSLFFLVNFTFFFVMGFMESFWVAFFMN